VTVTAKLDTNRITMGSSTTLRIYAQVAPAYRANAERIFSWYVDVLNTNGAAAQANYSAMQKSASDKDPQTSSTGFDSGANRRGIYDTFLNLPGAGVANPVELMSIPVRGLAVGQTRFRVQHGSGISGLSEDFIVARLSDDDPWYGGGYAQAFVDLAVVSAPTNLVKNLSITYRTLTGNSHEITLRYAAVPGYDCYLEYRDQLVGGVGWQTFAGGPHNSGLYRDTNNVSERFYRLRLAASTFGPFPLHIARTATPSQLRLSFPTVTGYNYTVEFRSNVATGIWQPLPGAPHNSGAVNVDNNGSQSFYRVRASPH